MSVCNEIKESRLLGSRVLQNRSPRWNSAALVTLLVVRRSGRADGESRGGGEAELTVSEEDGGSFVEARGHCGMVRSGECYHVLISDTKMKVQACGLVDAQQKSCVVTRNFKMRVATGRLDPPEPIHKCMLSITLPKICPTFANRFTAFSPFICKEGIIHV